MFIYYGVIDTHTIYNELTKDSAFNSKQAGGLVKVSRNLATKSDILKLKKEFKRDIQDLHKNTQSEFMLLRKENETLRNDTQKEFQLVRSEIQTIFNKLQVNLLFAMASMTGILIAAMKFLYPSITLIY